MMSESPFTSCFFVFKKEVLKTTEFFKAVTDLGFSIKTIEPLSVEAELPTPEQITKLLELVHPLPKDTQEKQILPNRLENGENEENHLCSRNAGILRCNHITNSSAGDASHHGEGVTHEERIKVNQNALESRASDFAVSQSSTWSSPVKTVDNQFGQNLHHEGETRISCLCKGFEELGLDRSIQLNVSTLNSQVKSGLMNSENKRHHLLLTQNKISNASAKINGDVAEASDTHQEVFRSETEKALQIPNLHQGQSRSEMFDPHVNSNLEIVRSGNLMTPLSDRCQKKSDCQALLSYNSTLHKEVHKPGTVVKCKISKLADDACKVSDLHKDNLQSKVVMPGPYQITCKPTAEAQMLDGAAKLNTRHCDLRSNVHHENSVNMDSYQFGAFNISITVGNAFSYDVDFVIVLNDELDEFSFQKNVELVENLAGYKVEKEVERNSLEFVNKFNQYLDNHAVFLTNIIGFTKVVKTQSEKIRTDLKSCVITSATWYNGSKGINQKTVSNISRHLFQALADDLVKSSTVNSMKVVASEGAAPTIIKIFDSLILPDSSIFKIARPVTGSAVPVSQICEICLETKGSVMKCCNGNLCNACQSQMHSCPFCFTNFERPGETPLQGIMDCRIDALTLEGYEGYHSFVITYTIFDGIQKSHHPHPGRSFRGANRIAYLPANEGGVELLYLFRLAFLRGLTFTIGTSVTCGKEDVVIWAGIPHKTKISGGEFGYPDENYLFTCKLMLSQMGVTFESITEEERESLRIYFSRLREKKKIW